MKRIFDVSFLPEKTIYNVFLCQCVLMLGVAIFITIFMNTEDDFSGKEHFDTSLNSLFENLYFSSVTIATIGYGDIVPKSNRAKALTMVLSIVTIVSMIFY